MRARLQAAKPAQGAWDAKNGPGRIMDIELAAQTVALIAGSPARGVERQIAAGAGRHPAGIGRAGAGLAAYRLLWRLHAAARLLTDRALDLDNLGEGGAGLHPARNRGCGCRTTLARALAAGGRRGRGGG